MLKPPLFRKVNTRARGVHHHFGGDYRHQRNTKTELRSAAVRQGMHGNRRRGLDYTPLFKFLLSKVGQRWDDVYAEAASRLNWPEPIFWLVARHQHEQRDYVRIGEASYYSGLYIDEAGVLQVANPKLGPSSLPPLCACCTHTFNGIRFTQSFRDTGEPERLCET